MICPPQRTIERFGAADGLLFRVKVSAEGEATARLLAEADAIRLRLPDDLDAHDTPLIKPKAGPLGHDPWRVRFDDDMPVLVINDRTPGWKELVMEPRFRAMVAPAAMRTVLTRILIIDLCENVDDEDETKWTNQWLRFAQSLPGVAECPQLEQNNGRLQNLEAVEEWIDSAVSAFASRSSLFDRFLDIRRQEVGQ
jgi:hypothetical protein